MKIFEILRRKEVPKGSDLGLEIEVEGENLYAKNSGYWHVHGDGSLRGESCEYVSPFPVSLEEVREALLFLQDNLKDSTLNFSVRTSVHVHVNVSYMELSQVAAFGYLYYLLEEPLIRYCGKSRIGNRFCLRMKDAHRVIDYFRSVLSEEGTLSREARDRGENLGYRVRYAAMNIASIPKFGSLEFRGMRGTLDVEVLSNWCKMLLSLRECAEEFKTPAKVKTYFLRYGAEALFNKVLGEFSEELKYESLVQDIEYNFSLSIKIPFEMKFSKKAKEVVDPVGFRPGDAERILGRAGNPLQVQQIIHDELVVAERNLDIIEDFLAARFEREDNEVPLGEP